MRASTRHKFIFIANPKCGTQSLRDALGPHSNMQGSRKQKVRNHSPAFEVKERFDELGRDWSEYFSFITIRNPWVKTASLYNYGLRQPRSGWHQAALHASSMSDFIRSPTFQMSARTVEYMTKDKAFFCQELFFCI